MTPPKTKQNLTINGYTPEREAEILAAAENFEIGHIIESAEDLKAYFDEIRNSTGEE